MQALTGILAVTFPFFALVLCGYVAARTRLLPLDAVPGLVGGELAVIRSGGLFSETFVCGTILQSIVTFQAVKNTQFLVLPFQKVLHICTNACPFHHQLIENMLHLMADKNAQLLTKLEVVSKKKLRKKLLTYFSFQSEQAGSQTFTIPLTRTQLADYLCADRTAVARELAHMKDEGLIEINQQRVTLY